MTIKATSSIDSDASDESFGVSNVQIAKEYCGCVDIVDDLSDWGYDTQECGDLGTIVGEHTEERVIT